MFRSVLNYFQIWRTLCLHECGSSEKFIHNEKNENFYQPLDDASMD